jgi:glycine oxidase
MTSRRNAADVIIVGGGLVGCTIARALSDTGRSVRVIERDSPGRRATWAAGGMLSPLIESEADDPFFHLADRSFDLYPALIDGVQSDSGIHVDYRTAGKLQCALDEEHALSLRRLYESPRAAQYGLHLYDGDEARRSEPGLSTTVVSALYVARDHCVDNRLLAQAMATSAESRGATFSLGVPAQSLVIEKGTLRGVRLASNELLEADHVIVAGGAWSGMLEGLPRPLPVVPVRGQMLCVDARPLSRETSTLERVVGTEHCYMIPRSDGRLLIGATVEHVGFQRGPTPAGLAWLIDAATAVLPAVGDLPILESWAGYRPGTPDDWPIIGADPDVRGLIYATGHYRNGILLAPVTAQAVTALIEGDSPAWLTPFGIERFTA